MEKGVVHARAVAYVELAQVCMRQNVFQFRGRFYFQSEGTSIGNSLSSFLAELFLCHFETSIEKHPLFPRFYRRYMDDIFVIQNRRMFEAVKALFEEKMNSIKKGAVRFTIERQIDFKISFLNTKCEIVDGKVEVDVHRKPTHTMRLITSDSYHDIRHKLAAYHSMAHFMFSLPLTKQKIEKETEKFLEIGEVNGFSRNAVLDIIDSHRRKKKRNEISTFYNAPNDAPPKRIGIRFYPEITRLLKPIYRRWNMELVHRNDGPLKSLLGTTKDVPPDIHKSGIYRIQCSHCGRIYIGMTIRKLFIRFNEHIKSANWKQKTAVGKHIFSSNHLVNISDLKLIKPVHQMWKIQFYEAIHIHRHKHENLLNVDDGNVKSPILKLFLVKRKVEEDIIDLTDDTLNSSLNDTVFFECE